MPDQSLDINRHPDQEEVTDILPTINTNTSTCEYSDDEYDEVIIFDTEERHSSGQKKENRGVANDDVDWEEIIFDDPQTAQRSNLEHKETKRGDSKTEMTGGQNPQN